MQTWFFNAMFAKIRHVGGISYLKQISFTERYSKTGAVRLRCETMECKTLGRVMANGIDEDNAYAARMDEWLHGKRWKPPREAWVNLISPLFTFPLSVRGARTPRPAHSAPPRLEGLLCCSGLAGGWLLVFSFVFPRPHIPWGWMASSRE
jgi:hypothetical protein